MYEAHGPSTRGSELGEKRSGASSGPVQRRLCVYCNYPRQPFLYAIKPIKYRPTIISRNIA